MWPSLMAVVERAEREVVVELGVPLGRDVSEEREEVGRGLETGCRQSGRRTYGPMSEGVAGSEGGGGRLMRVGAAMIGKSSGSSPLVVVMIAVEEVEGDGG